MRLLFRPLLVLGVCAVLLTACDNADPGATDLLTDARIARQAGDLTAAIDLLERALDEDPAHAAVRVELSSVLLERDGLDLLVTVPVPMCKAALGGEMEAPCLLGGENCDGACKIIVKVPEGAQTGKTLRVKGRGMPSLRSKQRGDLVVELFVETPTQLTGRQKELMRELAGLCGEQQHPKAAGFMGKAKRFWEEVTGSV